MMMSILTSMHSLFAQELIIRNTPLESGTIISGKRVGIWSYSDNAGEPGFVINYDTKEILFMAPDSSEFIVEREAVGSKSVSFVHVGYMGRSR